MKTFLGFTVKEWVAVVNLATGSIFTFAGALMKEASWIGLGLLLILCANIYLEVIDK